MDDIFETLKNNDFSGKTVQVYKSEVYGPRLMNLKGIMILTKKSV